MGSLNFVIYAPGIYDERGGGSVALHRLCHNIALMGENSYIYTDSLNPAYMGQMVSLNEAIELCKGGKGIAIYPEVTCGNPFKASKVMRWILYHVRDYDCHGVFSKTDLIYKFAPDFKLRYDRPIDGYLRAIEPRFDILVDRGEERKGACYLIKKGADNFRFNPIHEEHDLKLDGYPSLQYLADVFNKHEYFYSYDTATWLSVMAALCGCKSIVVPDGRLTASEWYKSYPYFEYGIAYGLDELPHAATTKHMARERIRALYSLAINQTQEFIKRAKEL
jgi:hypothetical protein